MSSATHSAVVTPGPRLPLEVIERPTVSPGEGEVRVHVLWTASTPLDLHQADSGLLVTPPQPLGDGLAGVVAEVGEGVELKAGDEVFGFSYRSNQEKAHQEYVTAPSWLFGKIPKNLDMPSAVTVPNNFVTAWHTIVTDLGLALPYPRPENYVPPAHDRPILVWGGATSAGQYAIQILRAWGFTQVLTTASPRHHAMLKTLGAAAAFDYHAPDVVTVLSNALTEGQSKERVLILDCVGSLQGSVTPIAEISKGGMVNIAAILLPVIIRDASDEVEPLYSLEPETAVDWPQGVEVKGVRTHFYPQNEFHRTHLQSIIMPALLEQNIIRPNKYRLIEGTTLLERAQAALDALRRKEPNGERLVWRVAE